MKKTADTSAKQKLEKSFMELLDEKPYPEITVTDIVNRAGVARVSYYRNFSSIMDIVESITDKMAGEFLTDIVPLFDSADDDRMREFLYDYFYEFKNSHSSLYPIKFLNKEIILGRLHKKISRIEHINHLDTMQQKYSKVAKLTLLEGIVKKWGNDGFIETPEEMAEYVMTIMQSF